MDANLHVDEYLLSNEAGIHPRIEHLSYAILQCIDGNNMPSGYIKGILELLQVATIF